MIENHVFAGNGLKKMKMNLRNIFCLLLTLTLCSSKAWSQNPPYANVNSDPTQVGSDYEFQIELSTVAFIGTDCNTFFSPCLNDLDVFWELIPVSECALCPIDNTPVASGTLKDVFWSENCVYDGSPNTGDCSNPGGCEQFFYVPVADLCDGITYKVVTYAFNPQFTGGNNGYQCCSAFTPATADLPGMNDACTLITNGGSGTGWFNPSYPQEYEFTLGGTPPPPVLNVTANVADGAVIPCGFEFDTDFSAASPGNCVDTKYAYSISINGITVESNVSDCGTTTDLIDYTAELIGCPDEPACIAGLGQYKVDCGINTIRWEATQECTGAVTVSEEITFTLDCAEADNLVIGAGEEILCPDETGTVAVAIAGNVNIPATNGSFELHWNNSDPYANPAQNYLGTGLSADLTNDGSFPYNTPITVIGTIWDDFDTDFVDGCQAFSGTAEFVMLEPIVGLPANEPCSINTMVIEASGGLPAYDNSGYTFDATSAGAGTNTTGVFNTTTAGDPIPAGTYTIIVTDAAGCSAEVEAEVYDPVSLEFDAGDCSDYGSLSGSVSGGQPGHPNQSLTDFLIISNLDGVLGSADASGNFSATGLSAGVHLITVRYNHLGPGGIPTGDVCLEAFEIEIYEPIDLEQTISCETNTAVVVASGGYAGSPNVAGASFVYELFEGNPPTGAALQSNGTGEFVGLDAGIYTVTVNDSNPNVVPANSCTESLSVEVYDPLLIDFTSDACSANTEITVDGASGGLDPSNPDFSGGSYTITLSVDGSNTPAPGTNAIQTSNPNADAPFTFSGLDASTSYFILLEDERVDPDSGENCSTTIGPITLSEIPEMAVSPGSCIRLNQITVDMLGGTGPFDYYIYDFNSPLQGAPSNYDPALATAGAVLDTNGQPLAIADASSFGAFTDVPAGNYTVYGVDANGCPESVAQAQAYDAFDIELSAGDCEGINLVDLASVSGGSDPQNTVGGGFPGSSYTIYLSSVSHLFGATAPGDVLDNSGNLVPAISAADLNAAPGTPEFTDVVAGSYFVVVTDDRGCSFSVPVEVSDAPSMEAADAGCDAYGQASVTATGGQADWNFYLYPQGAAFQSGGSGALQTDTGDGSGSDVTGEFDAIPAGTYTVYGVDANGCPPSSADVTVIEEIAAEFEYNCDYGTLTVSASGGLSEGDNAADYVYELFTSAGSSVTDPITASFADGAQTFVDLSAGEYVLQVSEGDCAIEIDVEVFDPIELEGAGCVLDSFEAMASGGYPGAPFVSGVDYQYTLLDSQGMEVSTNSTGIFEDLDAGEYTLEVNDNNPNISDDCTESLTFTVYAVEITNESCDYNTVSASIPGYSGPQEYILTDDATGISLPTSLTGNFTNVPAGNYTLEYSAGDGCSATTAVTIFDPIVLTDYSCQTGAVVSGGLPPYVFNITTLLGGLVGSNDTGIFPTLPTGSYNLIIRDSNNCSITQEVTCFNCEITANISSSCIGQTEYELSLELGGDGTYSISDGGALDLTGQSAGQIQLGDFPNGPYTITITSELDETCVETVEGEKDCFECDLGVVPGSAACLDLFNYEVPVTISGTGTFTITDSNGTQTGIEAGTITFGPFANGTEVITVTSELDENCIEEVSVSNDCFECGLNPVTDTSCNDESTFDLILDLVGNGTFTIDDGTNPEITGAEAGQFTFGPFNNNEIYNIEIISEVDPGCTLILSDTFNCFDCGLTVNETVNCLDLENFELELEIIGTGSFTINDNVGPAISGVAAGTITLGPYQDGNYSILVQSELDEECAEVVNGNSNCYQCDLTADITTNCLDLQTFNVQLAIGGSSTYTIDDGVNGPVTGQSAGTIDLGVFDNGSYTITIVDELDGSCREERVVNEDCFTCDLAASETLECIDLDSYTVIIELVGSGSYTLTSGDNILTNQTAGSISLGPIPNGPYSIDIVDESADDCVFNLTGERDCFECDLGVQALETCFDDFNYNVTLTIQGSGTYTIEDGQNAPITGVTAGNTLVGPFPSGDYTIDITDESDETCNEQITGNEVCFECDLQTNVLPFCQGTTEFSIQLTVVGTGTFEIDDGINPPLTGISSGVHTVGPLPNGQHNIVVTSEIVNTCTITETVEQDCFNCDLAASADATCVDGDTYELSVSITGSGTFTVADGVNPTQSNLEAGTYLLGDHPSGSYSVSVVSELAEDCETTISNELDCFECLLAPTSEITCLDNDSFEVSITIAAPGNYLLDDGQGNQSTVVAGTHIVGPFQNGSFTITVTEEDHPDCQFSISSEEDCFECDLELSPLVTCDGVDDYFVEVTVSGSGSYNVDDGLGNLQVLSAGLHTFGPFVNGSYNISFTDVDRPDCSSAATGEQDCFECDLDATGTAVCLDGETFELNVSISGSSSYIVDDGQGNVQTAVSAGSLDLGPFVNGSYNITITDELSADCVKTLSGELDCFECDLLASGTPTCVNGQVEVVLNILEGSNTYTVEDGVNPPIPGVGPGTSVNVGPFAPGPYSIFVRDETRFDCTTEVIGELECTCELTASASVECLDFPRYNLLIDIEGPGTFSLDDGNNTTLSGVSEGATVFGSLTSNVYVVTITSEVDTSCVFTLEGTQDCQECDLDANAEVECIDDGLYSVVLSISGSDTYTVLQGDEELLNSVEAGTYTVGPFLDNNLSFNVSSDLLSGCFSVLSPEPDCFVCDAQPAASTECFDQSSYFVDVSLNGSGTFTVEDGQNPPFVNQTGSVQVGPFLNGPYSVIVTSEQDPDCFFELTGEENCLECTLNVVPTATCQDDGLGFTVDLSIEGAGTYTVEDGVNPSINGVTAGVLTTGPFENGSYSIAVISELDPECEQIITGEEDCFECELSVDHVPECSTEEQFLVSVTISGAGTFSINDGIGEIIVNQPPGNIVLGPYLNGIYAFTITNEQDAACSELINGEFDCFECVQDAMISTSCDGFDQYNAVLEFSGAGTYTIDDGQGNIITDASSGTYNLGEYPNGAYLVTITSNLDETCVQTLTGVEDCFECDLDASESSECIDFESYTVIVGLSGSGTYTISDGQNPSTAGLVAGQYEFGPYTGSTYAITIQSELAPDCSATLIGTASCFQCQLPSAAATECIDEDFYNVLFTLPGPGSYTVNDNVNDPELLAPGNYVWGPISNGPYNISIENQEDEECSTNLTGINDCSSDEVCEVSLSGTPICVDENNFIVELSLTGLGSFSIDDGFTVLTGQTSGVIELGPYPSGSYNFVVSSEELDNCLVPFSGTYFCTPDFVCDLGVVVNTECTTVDTFDALLTLTGTGTYTLEWGEGNVLNNQSAGLISIADLPNGTTSVIITSEIDDECTFTVPVVNDCSDEFSCDLEVLSDIVCLQEGVDGFEIILTVSGTATYTITDPTINFNLEGAVAGQYVLGPYEDGAYNVTVSNEGNPICFQGINGNKECMSQQECDLSISLSVDCDGDDVVLLLTIDGTSIYSIFSDFQVIENVGAGVYELEETGFIDDFYNVFVQDNQEFACFESASGARDCPECDFTTTATPVCDNDNQFFVEVQIEGEGIFDISDGFLGSFLVEDVEAPVTVLVGPFDDGFYNIFVNSDDGFCFDQFSGSYECGPQVECDLAVSYAISDCQPNSEEYFVIVTIDGSDTYDISWGPFIENFIDNATAGVYELGPFTNEYSIFIDESNGFFFDCNTSIFGEWSCECDYSVAVDTECIDEDSYNLILTIEGEGTFTINDFEGEVLESVPAGEYILGPFTEDPFQIPEPFFYFVDIFSDQFPECTQNLFGNANCLPDPPCELVANVAFECYEDGVTFDMILTIEGDDSYTIEDGINDPLTGQSAGTYTLGPATNGAYEIIVKSEDFPDCTQVLSGGQFCEQPPECDLVANIQRECIDDDNYEISVTISGSGQYTLETGVGPDQQDLGPGTYTVSLPNGSYELKVYDQLNSLCQQEFAGDFDCTPVIPCDLTANVQAVCIDGEPSYNLLVDISGSSQYDIEVPGFETLLDVGTGVYTFGPIPNGAYSYLITDQLKEDCELSGNGVNDCPFFPPACDIETSISYECAGDGSSYFVIMDIAGASTYTMYEGLFGGGPPFNGDVILSSISAGQYTLGPYPAGGTTILLVDDFNVGCFADFVIVRDCSCDLDFVLDLECEDEDNYYINLEIQGSSTYEITVNEFGTDNDVVLTNVSAGLQTIGPFAFDQFFFSIADEQGDCFQDYLGVRDCSPNNGECDLEADIVNIFCDENNSVFIDVQLTGSSVYTIQLSNLPGDPVPAGIHTVGPVPDGFNYSFTVRDVDNGTCIKTFNGSYDCEPEVICDLDVTLGTPACNEANDAYFVDVTVSGSGLYNIDTGPGVPDIDDVASGTYTAGPFSGGPFSIDVTKVDDASCSEATNGNYSCAPPPSCDLGVEILDIECSGFLFFQFFTMTLQITGSDNYTIFVDNELLEDVPAGIYTFEDLTAQTAYEIYVESNNNPECFFLSSGPNPCNDEVDCSLTSSVNGSCSGEDTYTLSVTINGPSTYSVDILPAGDSVSGLQEGVYQFGPYSGSLGTVYQVDVIDELDGNCFFTSTGTLDCNPEPPTCALSAEIIDISCSGTSFFDLFDVTILIEGNGLYTITTADETIEGVAPGTITLGPYVAEELYSIRIEDSNISNCFQVVEAPNPCSDEVECDLFVNTEVQCLEEGYNILVDISGSDTYQVLGTIGGQPFEIQGVVEGQLELGPFSVEGTYDIQVISLVQDNCSYTNSAFAECPDEPLCDVGLELIEVICDEIDDQSVYSIELQLTGSETYTILLDNEVIETDVAAGTLLIGPFPASGGTFTVLARSDDDCFEQVSGTNNCVITGCVPPSAQETVVCNNNGTFNLIVVFDGAAQYDIEANIVGGQSDQALSQTSGSLELGPFVGGVEDTYEITVTQTDYPQCFLALTGSTDCPADPVDFCNLFASAEDNCIDEFSYEVDVTLTGSGTYNIYSDAGDLFGQTAGIINLGPFFSSSYTIYVEKTTDQTCNQTLEGALQCGEPFQCTLIADVDDECITEDTYQLVVEINGGGTFLVNDGFGNITTGLEAGTYPFGPFSANNYTVTIQSEIDPGCFQELTGSSDCSDDGTCTLQLGTETTCVSEDFFNVLLTITGNSTYTINSTASGFTPLEGQVAGDFLIENFEFGFFDIFVEDEQNNECFAGQSGNVDCSNPPNCDLNAQFIDYACIGDTDFYNININIEGSGTYSVYDGSQVLAEGVSQGELELGPFTTPPYNILISSDVLADCSQSLSGFAVCDQNPDECPLSTSAIVSCIDEDSYSVEVTFLGTGTYTVDDGQGQVLTGVVQGTVFLGPFPNGAYNITVTSEQIEDCTSSIVGFKDCANLPDCSLGIDGEITCIDDDFFSVSLTVEGIGTYIIFDGVNPAIGDVVAGTYEVGPIPSGSYTIAVTDQNNPDCFQTVSGNRNCSIDVPCNIDVVANASCIAQTTTYTVDLFVDGSGTYLIEGMGESIPDFTGGTLSLGPFDEQEYEFIITDQTDETCVRTASGTKVCDEDNPGGGGGGGGGEDECAISTSSEIVVLDATRFYVAVDFVAAGTWTIEDGVNSPLSGQTEGFVLVGPIFNGDYEIDFTSETVDDCGTTISGNWAGEIELGMITDFIWEDVNKDGIRDEDEDGFGGVTVTLFTDENVQLQTTVTDETGAYTFDNLAPGSYYIIMDVPFGLNISPQDEGTDESIDSDFNQEGISPIIELVEGDTVTEVSGGLYESFDCNELSANASIVCNGDQYFVGLSIVGGNSPYQINAGEFYNETIAVEDFPVPYLGPVPADRDLEIFVIDSEGCPIALLAVGDCENVGMELLGFDGRVEEEGNLLYWSTAMEEATDYFTLMRSTDGQYYESIAEIEAANYSSQVINYQHLDKDAPRGTSYYQLILTDIDGTETPSNIVSLTRGDLSFGIMNLSPVPVLDFLNVDFLLPADGTVQVQIHDVLGRLIFEERRSDEKGQYTWRIDAANFPAGTYLLSLAWEGEQSTIKFVKN